MERIFDNGDIILYGDENGVIHGTHEKHKVNAILMEMVVLEMIEDDLHQASNLAKLGTMVCDTYQQHTEEEMKSLIGQSNVKEEIFEILDAAWDAGKFTQVVVHVINRQGSWLEGLREAKDKFLD